MGSTPVTPTPNSDQTVPLQIAGVNDQAQPQVQPQAVPTAPTATTAQPQPVDPNLVHAGRFHRILSALAQGDQQVVRDQQGQPVVNPQTGQVVTRTMGKRSLGASILAGALSAMAANEANQPYRNGNGQWVNPSNQAVRAGEQAFQNSQPNARVQQAQQQANNQRTQQYAVYQQNVNMFKLAHEISHMKAEDKAAGVAAFASTYDAAENGDIPGYDTTLGDLSEKEAGEKLTDGSFNSTAHMMVPNGKTVPVLDAHGNPTGETEIRFMILPGQDGKIPLTKEMIQDHKELTGAAEGQTIPLTQWTKLVTSASSKQVLGSMLNTVGKAQNSAFDNPDYKGLDLNQFIKDSKATPKQIADIGHLSTFQNDPDKFAEGLNKIDTTGQIDAALRKQGINIDPEAWKQRREHEMTTAKEDASKMTPDQLAYYAANEPTTARGQAAAKTLLLQNQQAASKAGTEAKARVAAENSPTAIAGAVSKAKAIADAKGDNTTVVTYDPVQKKNVVMTRGEVPQGQFAYKVDANKINSTIGGMNDVQNKINELAKVVNSKDMDNIQPGLVGDAIAQGNKDFEVGAFGTHIPMSRVNALLNSENMKAANQATRNFITAYFGAREAITQLPRLQTFGQSSRMTEQQMKAAQDLLPGAESDTALARQKINALQGMIDPLRKQLPEMPGAALIPSFLEGGQPVYARNPQTGQRVISNDGGKTWQAAQ